MLHRFPNAPVAEFGRLRWDMNRLFSEIMIGLRRLGEEFPDVESIGVDGWGVDVALLDGRGALLERPISYRDGVSGHYVESVHAVIDRCELFTLNGLQFLPFTTIYQLAALRQEGLLARAHYVVMLPDLIAYWLTDCLGTELTNASTTGLLKADTGTWSTTIFSAIDVSPFLFPPLRVPGSVLGPLTDAVTRKTGLSNDVQVMTVASHDTASAVVAIPSRTPEFVYVSSGTWSLVGTEVDRPLLTHAALSHNFTNERGTDGRTRLLRNVGGLWLLQECLRTWRAEGLDVDLPRLLAAAAALPAGPVFDVDDPGLVAPGHMPHRIADAVGSSGGTPPRKQPAVVRCILDSLAEAYAATTDITMSLANRRAEVVHIVGGGSRNGLLCQLTANVAGLPVVAGPAEGSALGNILVQARAQGAVPADLDELRLQLADSEGLVLYSPSHLHRGAT